MIESELRGINSGKRGRPCTCCTSPMLWIMYIMEYKKELTLRKADGIPAGHGLEGPHHSTMLRRLDPFFVRRTEDGYGIRCKVRCAFSDMKRLAAETVSATGSCGIGTAVLIKVLVYNIHKGSERISSASPEMMHMLPRINYATEYGNRKIT